MTCYHPVYAAMLATQPLIGDDCAISSLPPARLEPAQAGGSVRRSQVDLKWRTMPEF